MGISATRERSFGGKAGTWLRKKRKLSEEGKTMPKAAATTLTSSSSSSSLLKEDDIERRLSSGSGNGSGGTTHQVIGWDDVRGRPIYHLDPSKHGNASEDDEEDEIDSPARKLPYTKTQQNSSNNNIKSRKLRSYGGTRRNRVSAELDDFEASFFESATTSSNKTTTSEEQSELEELSANSESETETTTIKGIGFGGAQQSSRRVSNVHEPSTSPLVNPTGSGSDSSVFEFCEDPLEPTTKSSRTGSAKKNEECKTPTGGRVLSISSTTSLSAAREFFRKLDREHLAVAAESSATTPRRKRRGGRSRRTMSSSNNLQLAQEYDDYTAACKASSVSPLPKADYVTNRGSFFRATEMYDGFLDE